MSVSSKSKYGLVSMKNKQLWINQIKGMCICLVVIYHSVITFYPHILPQLTGNATYLAKLWVYGNLYLAPFRMPVFFFISGFLVTRYTDQVPWRGCINKRVWNIAWVLVLWGVIQWLLISHINQWIPGVEHNPASNAAYAETLGQFAFSMLTAGTSLWYLYALVVYFIGCKLLHRYKNLVFPLLILVSVAINFLPTPFWGMNSVIRNMPYYAMGAWFGSQLVEMMKQWQVMKRPLPLIAALVVALALYFKNVNLPLSMLSILLIMKCFFTMEQKFGSSPNSLFNVIGSNTIAIYTTHRILVEALSLVVIGMFNQHRLSSGVEMAILLCYPLLSLGVCTLLGLVMRRLSKVATGDLLFTPPRGLVAER
jgi:uncharacterized membrane protein YcfT